MERSELRVEIYDLAIIEIEGACGSEDREICVQRRRRGRGKTSAVQEHTCGTLTALREGGRKTSSAGKPRKIHAVVVNRQARMGVLNHRLGGLERRLPGAVVRIVRAGHDVAVTFRRVLHQFQWHTSAGEGIECIDNRPAFFASVMRGNVKCVALVGLRRTRNLWDDYTL